MDKIHIRDILLRCIIGVNEDERLEKQDVVINVTMSVDLRKAGESDEVRDTVDYSEIKKRIVSVVEKTSYMLLEALAGRIAEICLEHEGVEQVQVTVDKPGALRFARSVAVEITRDKK